MRRVCASLVLLCLCVPAVQMQEQAKRVTLSPDRVTFGEAVQQLGKETGYGTIVSRDVDSLQELDLELTRVSPRTAADLLGWETDVQVVLHPTRKQIEVLPNDMASRFRIRRAHDLSGAVEYFEKSNARFSAPNFVNNGGEWVERPLVPENEVERMLYRVVPELDFEGGRSIAGNRFFAYAREDVHTRIEECLKLLGSANGGACKAHERQSATWTKLREQNIFRAFDAMPLGEVVRSLRAALDLNIVLDPGDVDPETEVSFSWSGPSVEFIELMLADYELKYELLGEVVLISSIKAEYVGFPEFGYHVYEIADILENLRDGGSDLLSRDTCYEIIAGTSVATGDWSQSQFVYLFGTKLVVMGDLRVQHAVAEYLDELRREDDAEGED